MANYLPIERTTIQKDNIDAAARYLSGYADFLEHIHPTRELRKHLKQSQLLDIPALATADTPLRVTQRINLVLLGCYILVKRPDVQEDDLKFGGKIRR